MGEFTILEKRGERTWRFVSERLNWSKKPIEPRFCSLGFSVADAWRVSACAYFREVLKGIDGDTVALKVVLPSQAKLPPHWGKNIDEWRFEKGDYAVVTNSGVMVGILCYGYLERAGYKVGDYVPFAVVRPLDETELTLTNYIELFILANEKGKKLTRQRAEKRAKDLIRRSVSVDLPKNFKFFIAGIYEDGFLENEKGDEIPIHLTVSFSVDHKPTQKPHVLIKAKEEILFDVNARSSKYKDLADCVNKKIIYSCYVKKKYDSGIRANYWSLLVIFQD